MKVGDLVIMSRVESSVVGLVVKMPYVGPNGEQQQTPRVGVYWPDGGGVIDWEPMNWLEVVSESR
mgnify:FL=1